MSLRFKLNHVMQSAKRERMASLLVGQPHSQGTLSTSRKYTGYGWSRVCWILADSRDVIEGRDWKVIVCLH